MHYTAIYLLKHTMQLTHIYIQNLIKILQLPRALNWLSPAIMQNKAKLNFADASFRVFFFLRDVNTQLFRRFFNVLSDFFSNIGRSL